MALHNHLHRANAIATTAFMFLLVLVAANWASTFLLDANPKVDITIARVNVLYAPAPPPPHCHTLSRHALRAH